MLILVEDSWFISLRLGGCCVQRLDEESRYWLIGLKDIEHRLQERFLGCDPLIPGWPSTGSSLVD